MAGRVLVIEDEIALGRLLQRVLEEDGFESLLERRGDAGLRAALERRPDAVVLDLTLPDQNGLEVCAALRSLHCAEGWTPDLLAERLKPAFSASFVPLERSQDVFSWDPI